MPRPTTCACPLTTGATLLYGHQLRKQTTSCANKSVQFISRVPAVSEVGDTPLEGSRVRRYMLVTAKHIVGVGAHTDAGSATSSSAQTAKASMHEAFVSAAAASGQAEDGGSTSGWRQLDSSAAASDGPASTAAAAAESADVIVNSTNGSGIVSSSGGSNVHPALELGDSNGSGGNGVMDPSSGSGSGGELVSPSELEALINEAGSAAWGEWASLPPGVQTATGVVHKLLATLVQSDAPLIRQIYAQGKRSFTRSSSDIGTVNQFQAPPSAGSKQSGVVAERLPPQDCIIAIDVDPTLEEALLLQRSSARMVRFSNLSRPC